MSFPTHWKMDNEICRNFVNCVDGIIIEDTAPIRLNDIDFYKANEARLCSLISDVDTLTNEYEHIIKCKQYNDVENQYYFSAGMLGVYGIPMDNHVSDNDSIDLKCSLYPKNYFERISSYLPVMDIDKLLKQRGHKDVREYSSEEVSTFENIYAYIIKEILNFIE